MTLSSLFRFIAAASLVTLFAGCGDNAKRTLEISAPKTTEKICTDTNIALDGVQVDVKVIASGFSTSDLIILAIDGTPDPQTAQSVPSNGMVTFTGVTLADGTHALWAESGDIQSDAIVVTIDGSGPLLAFANLTGGETLGAGDDKDPITTALDFDIEIVTDLADDEAVTFTVTPPDGAPVNLGFATVQSEQATFPITFNQFGSWNVEIEASDECGNTKSTSIQIFVTVDPPPCDINIEPRPQDVDGLRVLNAAMDPSTDEFFQATIMAEANPGDTITLSVDSIPDSTKTADGGGLASWTVDLAEGERVIQAFCEGSGGNQAFSLPNHVFVDTIAPTCAIQPPLVDDYNLTPEPGETTAVFDVDVDVGGGDAEGELVFVTVGLAPALAAIVSGGTASVTASRSSPQNGIPITASTNDHALNPCETTVSINYVTDGCPITWISPQSTVITDADSTPNSGFQADVTIEVDGACAGRDVTLLNCDIGGPLVVAATGSPAQATFRVTACSRDSCETTRNCTAEVTNDAGIVTSVNAPLSVDNIVPPVVMAVVNPDGACGKSITPAQDFDPVLPGVQVQARMTTGPYVSRWYQVDGGAQILADTSGFATLTVVDGANTIIAYITDSTTLTGSSAPCVVTLETLAVTIDTPIDGQTLGPSDGTISGSDLLIDVCGTVDEVGPGVTVDIRIDGGAAQAATVDGVGDWCVLGVALPDGPHAIVATGNNTMTMRSGSATADVTVDLVPPDDASDFAGTIRNRASIQAQYTEPADGGATVAQCEIRSSLATITNGNWASATVVASLPGAGAGMVRTFNVDRLRLGPANTWHLAVRCEDTAGNTSNVMNSGPHVLAFTQSAAIVPAANPEIPGKTGTSAWLGYKLAGGDLNNDGFSDVIAGAPEIDFGDAILGDGAVYIYMGSATGIGAAPDFVIRAINNNTLFGQGIAVLDWNGDNVDDLAVAAPFANGFTGEVFIFFGDAANFAPTGSTTHLTSASANVVIDNDAVSDIWFTFAGMGGDLAQVDFDGDGRDDLLIGASGADDFHGGAILLFGGTSTSTITFPSAQNGAKAYRFSFSTTNCNGLTCAAYGTKVYNLGRLGDGGSDFRDDVLIASSADAVTDTTPVLSEDRVFAFYGRPQPIADLVDISYTNAEQQIVAEVESDNLNEFGFSASSISDIDGDGRREIVVGAGLFGSDSTGRVYVVPGGTTIVGSPITQNVGVASIVTITGDSTSRRLGAAIPNAGSRAGGNVEGDGLDDLFLGSGGNVSHLWVLFADTGMSDSTNAVADDAYALPSAFPLLQSAAWVGDVNNDGLDDVCWASYLPGVTSDPGGFQILY